MHVLPILPGAVGINGLFPQESPLASHTRSPYPKAEGMKLAARGPPSRLAPEGLPKNDSREQVRAQEGSVSGFESVGGCSGADEADEK